MLQRHLPYGAFGDNTEPGCPVPHMQRYLLAGVWALAVAALVVAGAATPSGSYCGGYLGGMVKGQTDFAAGGTSFDLDVDAFGQDAPCRNIKFSLGAAGELVIPDMKDPQSCVAQLVSQYSLPQVSLTFRPDSNTIDFNVGVADITLTPC